MKIVLILFILLLLVIPTYGFADCSKNGATVIYINGIFGKEESVKDDLKLLKDNFKKKNNKSEVAFISGFNQSHGGGVDDVVASAFQMYAGASLDHDLVDILRQAHADLKTQKVILLGYSQGSFYSNAAYDYLISHGVDASAINVYNIGTPASWVAGKGKYTTSSTDKLIERIRQAAKNLYAKNPLPANIDLPIPDEQKNDTAGGHYFSANYLAFGADRIIEEIDGEINSLSAVNEKEECFIQPEKGVKYYISDTGYAFADGLVENHEALATAKPPEQMASMANSVGGYLHGIGQGFMSGVNKVLANARLAGTGLSNAPIFQNSLNSPSQDNFVGEDIPVVQLTVAPFSQPTPQNPQDTLDNIQEKFDILQQQSSGLFTNNNEEVNPEPDTEEVIEPEIQPQQDVAIVEAVQTNNSGAAINFPKVLISEVKVAGTEDEKEEFVELYNPNNEEIDLTGWYLQRKTSGSEGWSTYVSKNSFLGKKIFAKGYFLISRSGYYAGLADVFTDSAITADNSFAIKNPNGQISDKLGFGTPSDSESTATINPEDGKSIGRKVLADNTEQDEDNNSTDFELNTPTPKEKNIKYVNPDEPPVLKNILITEIQVNPIAQRFVELYNPNNVEIDLTGYYLQRKDANDETWGSFVSSTNFENKKIGANSYFLVSKEIAGSDILLPITLTADNSLALKDSKRDIVDKVGYGNAKDPETTATINPEDGKSISRKLDNQDTDNNLNDFELTISSPKAKNIQYANWAQGKIDSFTPEGSFVLHTRDFMPNQSASCRYSIKTPFSAGSGPCSGAFPSYIINLSSEKTVGDYEVKISYCGNDGCPGQDRVGNYYKMHFDGTVWSALEIDPTKTRKSSEAELLSSNQYILSSLTPIYSTGVLTGNTATITNVFLGTAKSDFESVFTASEGATIDFSGVADPVTTGNTVVVTAEDGTTKSIYTVTTETITWSKGTINSFTPDGKFVFNTDFFTTVPGSSCNSKLYRSLYPYKTNGIGSGSFGCKPIYNLNLSSQTNVGDYTSWMYDNSTNLGKYYSVHFDGTVWTVVE